MNTENRKSVHGVRGAGLMGVCVCVLGLAAWNGGASVSNPRRDVSNEFASGITAPIPPSGEMATANATATVFSLASDEKSQLTREERFTNKTDTVVYRLQLENPADTVHLKVSAEVKRGVVRWELIDPTGATRSKIGTTEHASMDTTNIQAIKGEWTLRMILEDATGRYHVYWAQ
jgi:hypothetical protein